MVLGDFFKKRSRVVLDLRSFFKSSPLHPHFPGVSCDPRIIKQDSIKHVLSIRHCTYNIL